MTHIKGYLTKLGSFVAPHEDSRPAARANMALHNLLLPALRQGVEKTKKLWTGPTHPKADDEGNPVPVYAQHTASPEDTWEDARSIATFVPGGKAPAELNGLALAPWEDHPTDADEWNDVQGTTPPVDEPPLPESKKEQAAGVVIEEPDGRVWVVHPTNAFGGYRGTFPKGHVEDGIDLQPSAIKEAYEESGLKVELTGFLCDVERTTTTCRYYLARRVGGTPTDCGWESQAVSLVPRDQIYDVLNRETDHGTAEALGAGPRPKPKPLLPPKLGHKGQGQEEMLPWW